MKHVLILFIGFTTLLCSQCDEISVHEDVTNQQCDSLIFFRSDVSSSRYQNIVNDTFSVVQTLVSKIDTNTKVTSEYDDSLASTRPTSLTYYAGINALYAIRVILRDTSATDKNLDLYRMDHFCILVRKEPMYSTLSLIDLKKIKDQLVRMINECNSERNVSKMKEVWQSKYEKAIQENYLWL